MKILKKIIIGLALIIIVILVILTVTFYNQKAQMNSILEERNLQLDGALTGVIATAYKDIEKERASMTKDSLEIAEKEKQIKLLEEEKALLWSGYNARYENVTQGKQLIKEQMGL